MTCLLRVWAALLGIGTCDCLYVIILGPVINLSTRRLRYYDEIKRYLHNGFIAAIL